MMIIKFGPVTIDYSDICMVLGKLHKVDNDIMENKGYNDVINIVLRENSYIDVVQEGSSLSALKFCFISFLTWNAFLLSFKLWLYKIVNYDTVWLRYPLLILVLSTAVIATFSSNLSFWKCFSRKRMQGIIPAKLKIRFVFLHNWYANAIIFFSTIVSAGFVFMISFYDSLFYGLELKLTEYSVLGISGNESSLGFVNETLAGFQHTSILLQFCYLFVFVVVFVSLIVVFCAARIAKPVIYKIDINRSAGFIEDTVKPDGVSIEKQNSEVVTLDLLNEKLTFLFDAVIIFDYVSKDLIVFRGDVVKQIIVKEANHCKQITYNPNLKKWVMR